MNAQVESEQLGIFKETTNNKLNNSRLVYKIFKRLIDIIGSLVGITILIPLTICIQIVKVLLKDDGPLFYTQERIGKDGKKFKLYKFRSMVVGADKILHKYLEENPEAKKEWDANQKLQNDPRVTKVGKFLRKTSLDEFPQFINVLKGDMSLVGPRPIVDREVELFGNKMRTVHSIRPGITGYWAANGRSDTTYEERVQMEVYYVENFSLVLDIKIILKTIGAVIKKEGAR